MPLGDLGFVDFVVFGFEFWVCYVWLCLRVFAVVSWLGVPIVCFVGMVLYFVRFLGFWVLLFVGLLVFWFWVCFFILVCY